MVSRLIGLALGLLLTAIGYLIVTPLGDAVPATPPVDLGAFDGHRALIGWGALALGIAALVANLLPGRAPAKKKTAPAAFGAAGPITFADDPAPGPEPSADPAGLVLEPAPPAASPFPVAPRPVAAAPTPAKAVADGPAQQTFSQMRQVLRDKVRAEDWAAAGDIAARLPRLALTHRDRMQAAQDQGDFLRGQGRGEDAAEAYSRALSYARLIHDITPEDPVAAADLAGALVNVGDMAAEEGRIDAAIGAFEQAVDLRRAVVSVGARRADRRALSIALERLADVREDRGHRSRALDLYRESMALAGALASEDPQRYGADLAVTRQRLGELEARLASV